MLLREKTIINRLNLSSIDFFHIPALANPFGAQRRKSLRDIAVKIGIAPGAAPVVHAHGIVYFDMTIHRLRRRDGYLPKRNSNAAMQFAGPVNCLRTGESRRAVLGFSFTSS